MLKGLRRIVAMVIRDAAQHRGWAPRRAFELLVMPPLLLITHPSLHARVRQVGRLPAFRGMTEGQPRFLYKYLNNLYLVRGLRVAARGQIFIHHYHFLADAFEPGFLARLRDEKVALLDAELAGTRYQIVLSLAFEFFNEGEMTLCLLADGETLYTTSFVIVPGAILKIDTQSALLVVRQQGSRGKFKAIAKATKDLMDLTPQFILFSALQGIAITLGIGYIGSVSGARHISNAEPDSPLFRKAYDEFMVSQGAVGSSEDMFRLQVPIREKPVKYIKRDHRTRTLKKRRFRSHIVHDVRGFLSQSLRADFTPAKGR